MSKRSTSSSVAILAVLISISLLSTAPVAAQFCGPLDNGRVANVVYKGNAVFFDPIVRYEYDRAVLTISGPCEAIVRTFKPGEQIFFDLGEVKRTLDGSYTWQLRFTPRIDPEVQEALQEARGSGKEDDVWWSFWQKGAIPAEAERRQRELLGRRGRDRRPGFRRGEPEECDAWRPVRAPALLGSAALAAAPAAARGGS